VEVEVVVVDVVVETPVIVVGAVVVVAEDVVEVVDVVGRVGIVVVRASEVGIKVVGIVGDSDLTSAVVVS